jgi:DNA-directed RNA polymerase subunit RPC12/RpoP
MSRVDKGDVYRCEACGEEYVAERTAAECVAEQEVLFGKEHDPKDAAVVCDDCHKKILAWYERQRRRGEQP